MVYERVRGCMVVVIVVIIGLVLIFLYLLGNFLFWLGYGVVM